MNRIVFDTTTRIWAQRDVESERGREREGHGKNHRGFMMSEPSCERAFPLTGKEILLQSVSLLKGGCNRHKHVPPLSPPLPFTFPVLLLVCPVFKSAGNDAAH